MYVPYYVSLRRALILRRTFSCSNGLGLPYEANLNKEKIREVWWRRWESNPRPENEHYNLLQA